MAVDPAERSLRARLAAHASWAKTVDPAARLEKAHAAAEGRFAKQARELHPDADDEQIAKVTEHLRKAHFTRLALASVRARRRKREERSAE